MPEDRTSAPRPFNERRYIAQIEAADPESFAQELRQPTAEKERALRAYFGDERYERLHGLALRKRLSRAAEERRNVIVIHGIMGAELTAHARSGDDCPVWVNLWRIARGFLSHLRLADDGLASFDPEWEARASGMMKQHYGELILSLSRRWRVLPFWFDWRKDLDVAAAKLHAEIEGWLKDDEPAHIVAHSMGGLVARTFIHRFPDRWKAMADAGQAGARGGRLVMLGTPNHGSFAIPQIFTGLEKKIRQLAMLDLSHNRNEVLAIVNSFPGSYQMLPSPLVMPDMAPLYDAATYGDLGVSQAHLDRARAHHQALAGVVDPERMVYVAGDRRATLSNIVDLARVGDEKAYGLTTAGDGRVPHLLGLLDGVPTYYVEETHGALPSNPQIVSALDELLETGASSALSDKPAKARGGDVGALREEMADEEERENDQIENFLRRLQTRGLDQSEDAPISDEERRVEDVLLRGFVEAAQPAPTARALTAAPEKRTIRIELRLGDITKPGAARQSKGAAASSYSRPNAKGRRADAISVGHYVGTLPQAAELAIDRAVSEALGVGKPKAAVEGEVAAFQPKPRNEDLLLAQLTQRGTIRGELGQPFILPDPRTRRQRLIAIAGMGIPGRFGAPELSVTVRELCWALGSLGKTHLASVVIGAGNGNLEAPVALRSWMEGIYQALTSGGENRLERITFIEYDWRRIGELSQAIEQAGAELRGHLTVEFDGWTPEELKSLAAEMEHKELEADREQKILAWSQLLLETEPTKADGPTTPGPSAAAEAARRRSRSSEVASRVTVSLEGRAYRFGAVTHEASIPERTVPLDPALVTDANRELVAANSADSQGENGQFMGRLLVPRDLRAAFKPQAPLVLILDSTTARIHWELVAQVNDLDGAPAPLEDLKARSGNDSSPLRNNHLGLERGLTRQFRTVFAPPPEPPPTARRLLRVLVVADPAADARLPGAEEEGAEIVDLFEAFNEVYADTPTNRVEVTRLFGPRSATRTNVLRHLMLRPYDVLHFAGHAKYDADNPAQSGWVFSNGTRLTANELDRIDRIPRFVFSNACESGITPDRSEDRSASLAPSFAEAFFARGVSNFVCTAWPVDDLFARVFARELYSGLLGLEVVQEESGVYKKRKGRAMYEAMREARRAVAKVPAGLRTWGAYQHYGSPYYRFFRQEASTATEE